MTARRFDPERNQYEIRMLYGDAHADRQPNWDTILSAVDTKDNRDLREPRQIGQKILRKVARRQEKT